MQLGHQPVLEQGGLCLDLLLEVIEVLIGLVLVTGAVADRYERTRVLGVSYAALMGLPGAPEDLATDPQVVEQLEIAAKYQGYIDRQQDEVARQADAETTPLPADLDYTTVRGLSKEVQGRLNQHKPETIGQASRIQGITPAAISLLLVWLKRSELARGREKSA